MQNAIRRLLKSVPYNRPCGRIGYVLPELACVIEGDQSDRGAAYSGTPFVEGVPQLLIAEIEITKRSELHILALIPRC
jgi:hypothetical protein